MDEKGDILDDAGHVPLLAARINGSGETIATLFCDATRQLSPNVTLAENVKQLGWEQGFLDFCQPHLAQVLATGRRSILKVQLGNGCHYQISLLPETAVNEGRTILLIICDITVERQLQNEWQEQQARLKVAQEIAKLGYFTRDVPTGNLQWSAQAYINLGLVPYSVEPTMSLYYSRIHPDDVERVKTELSADTCEQISIEYRVLREGGMVGWLHSIVQSQYDETGQLIRRFGTVQDITARKIMELELQELTQQLKQANEAFAVRQMGLKLAGKVAKLGYFEWHIADRTVFWSDQQFRNLGYQPGAVVPTLEKSRDAIHPDDLEMVRRVFHEVFTKRYAELHCRALRPDGTIGWLHGRIHATVDEQGQCVKVFGVTQDYTEQKHEEERIRRVEKGLVFINELYGRSMHLNRFIIEDYPAAEVIKGLNEFGIETKCEHCCFVVALTGADELPDKQLYTEGSQLTSKQAVLVWLAEKELGWLWKCNDHIIVLRPNTNGQLAAKQQQSEFAQQLCREIAERAPQLTVQIGISGLCSLLTDFKGLYQRASRAVVAAAVAGEPVLHYEDIGLYEVAFQLLQDKHTCALVEQTLGKLSAYDKTRRSALMLTLEYVLTDMSLKEIAQKLYIHHNTAIWRKKRIEELLGLSLDAMETKVLLLLYFKIWKIQKARVSKE